jgi:hypothetical protein
MRRHILLVLTLVALGLAGCGGDSSPAVVRVGDRAITRQTAGHWQVVLSLEGGEAGRSATPATLRRQAIGRLIAADWLIGEAAARGRPVSRRAVDGQLNEQQRAYPSKGEFLGFLRATGKTVADARLEIEAELAARTLRRMVIDQVPTVSVGEARRYYAAHLHQFSIPEQRNFEIVNNLTRPAAERLKREVESGRNFSNGALQETLGRFEGPIPGEKGPIVRAIFAARPHEIGGPEPLLHAFSLFEVTRIRLPSVKSFAAVRESIVAKLTAQRRQRAIAAFTASWVSKWTARTDCSAGYVVSGCRQAGSTPSGFGLNFG